ncbi:MAG: aminotransferase class V-fold PLP-dependent enzyme [Lewinellaceae bacterium]|nr:aminotransferase class V-fold PLP-dependent enzyme [Lewinellaceae bacterium]
MLPLSPQNLHNMLEQYFQPFRHQIIGIDQHFPTPFGEQKILYADWTASGRLYRPIEDFLANEAGPYVGNTHTETTVTGSCMTQAYHQAKHIIKQHVGARDEHVLISSNSGMTGVVNKFQRILGLKVHERFLPYLQLPDSERPVVFITHMEHHSNQTSWLETIALVEVIPPDADGLVDLGAFAVLLEKHKHRKTKIAAVTSCSNVTGIITPYHQMAKMIHEAGGVCFVDFACSAPYIDINMCPDDESECLDAIFFSPHKFLGGPGTTGILVFDPKLYTNKVPDHPGGGTVDWTNPWGEHKYHEEIEAREDGGTPAFLQTIKVALCTILKDEMGTENMVAREHELLSIIWPGLKKLPNLHLLADNVPVRLGVISFYIEGLHYNLGVKLLNDRFGIQVRGGCSCAGTYGHYLLGVSYEKSHRITDRISQGDLSEKPGWMRLSIHPTMTDEEAHLLVEAITDLSQNHEKWAAEYVYDNKMNEFFRKGNGVVTVEEMTGSWFEGFREKCAAGVAFYNG